MQYILLNAVPILLAAAAGFIASAVYAWARRRSAGEMGGLVGLAAFAFVAEAWLASILAGALILAPHQAGVWVMSLGSAVIIWIGFVLPVLLVSLRWRGAGWTSALADAAMWLAVMLVQAVVLQAVGLRHP